MSTGPVPEGVTSELEALKRWLVTLRPEDLPKTQSDAMAAEISAIRLQLKRLEADRKWVEELSAVRGSPLPGSEQPLALRPEDEPG